MSYFSTHSPNINSVFVTLGNAIPDHQTSHKNILLKVDLTFLASQDALEVMRVTLNLRSEKE